MSIVKLNDKVAITMGAAQGIGAACPSIRKANAEAYS